MDMIAGGSKGIGRLIVQALLAEGANVSYCARNPRGDEFSAFQGAADNARAVASTVDIANPTDIKNWVERSVEEFGRIDCVVANGEPINSLSSASVSNSGTKRLPFSRIPPPSTGRRVSMPTSWVL